jgi:radical SAM protein with 4Fe4S-binding SPASM domain
MSVEQFEDILRQLKPYTDEIALHVMGDPMVLSNLGDYLDSAYVQGFKVMVTTSGFYLDPSKRAMLFHPAIRQVNISLNSFNANSVARSFENYLQPILDFCEEKQRQSHEFFINLRLWNLDEVHSAGDFNRQLFAVLEKHFSLDTIASPIVGERQSIRLAPKTLLHFDRYFEWPHLNASTLSHGYCQGLLKQIAILADGRVVPCCLDGEGIMTLGNVTETNLDKILTSKRASLIREGFLQGQCHEELCQKCRYKARFSQ